MAQISLHRGLLAVSACCPGRPQGARWQELARWAARARRGPRCSAVGSPPHSLHRCPTCRALRPALTFSCSSRERPHQSASWSPHADLLSCVYRRVLDAIHPPSPGTPAPPQPWARVPTAWPTGKRRAAPERGTQTLHLDMTATPELTVGERVLAGHC